MTRRWPLTPTERRGARCATCAAIPDNGMVAGVCEGLGKRLDIDPLLLRIVFGATTLASGLGLVAYVLAWMLVPAEGDEPRRRRSRRRAAHARATGAPRSRSGSAWAASSSRCC